MRAVRASGTRVRPTAHRSLPPAVLERKGVAVAPRGRRRALFVALVAAAALITVSVLGPATLLSASAPLPDEGDYGDAGLAEHGHADHAHHAHARSYPPFSSAARETLQCPKFSGPGWRPDYHPNLPVEGASEASRVSSADQLPPPDADKWVPLSPLPPGGVRLTPGESPFAEAEATNLQYLNSLEPDRLTWSFRAQAGLAQPEGATPYGGWESPGSELRGHFVGHYLSAAAFAHQATGDAEVLRRMEAVVATLAEGQSPEGYVSAFPTELLDRFEDQKPVWAPYYTLHKILQGLHDAHETGGSALAGQVAQRFAAYIAGRAEAVVAKRGIDWWRGCLNQEYGGVAEALRATGGRQMEPSAQLWDKPCFHGPLAAGHDILDGLHANAHLPMLPGAVARFAATGESAFLESAQKFFALMNNTRAYATGGTSHGELWHAPGELGNGLGGPAHGGTESAEQCATHNALRTATWLLRARTGATVRAAYADYIERATLNGILGAQRGSDPGRYLYMYPMGHGVSKGGRSQWRETGWSTPFESFWCCTGTMIEAFARFGDGLYLQHARARRLYFLHYASSSVQWPAAGASVVTSADSALFTRPSPTARLLINVSVTPTSATATHATLALRIPSWAAPGPQLLASLDGGVTAAPGGEQPQPGRFLLLTRDWARDGPQLTLSLPLGDSVRAERILDDREPFRRLYALLWGPLVLGGLTEGPRQLGCTGAVGEPLHHCVRPVPDDVRLQLLTLRAGAGEGSRALTRVQPAAAEGQPLPPPVIVWATPPAAATKSVARRRSGGSDESAGATWRMLPTSDGGVALEAMDRPGLWLCVPHPDGQGGLVLAPSAPHDELPRDAQTLDAAPPPCARWVKREDAGGFRLESRLYPGTFLSAPTAAEAAEEKAAGGAVAGALPARSAAAQGEPIVSGEPLETLPAAAFWALSSTWGRKVLLIPLADIIDESYSAYWEIA